MSTLLLRLGGPTQAWHVRRRRITPSQQAATLPAGVHAATLGPTFTGVTGLLAAAQGRPRGADMSDLRALDILVRTEQLGQPWAEFRIRHRSTTSGAVITEPIVEAVLDDALFLVAIAGDAGLVQGLAAAVSRPVFPLYLGRREYPPSPQILIGTVDRPPEVALSEYPWLAGAWYQRQCPPGVLLPLARIRQGRCGEAQTIQHLAPVHVTNPTAGPAQGYDYLAAL